MDKKINEEGLRKTKVREKGKMKKGKKRMIRNEEGQGRMKKGR